MRLESENSLIYLIIMPPPKPANKHVVNTPVTPASKAPVKDGSKAPAPAAKDGAKGGKKGGNPKDVKPTA